LIFYIKFEKACTVISLRTTSGFHHVIWQTCCTQQNCIAAA